MRKLTIILMLLVAVSFADVLFDQGYDGTCDDGWGSSDSYRLADDFVLANPGRLESIEWWSFYYLGTIGSDYNLRIYDDNGGEPGTILWEVTATPVDTDTGDDYLERDLYHTVVTLDAADYFTLESGTTYWLSTYWTSKWFYWACWSSGNMMDSENDGPWSDVDHEAMFRLSGTNNGSTVEETTWGQIKAL